MLVGVNVKNCSEYLIWHTYLFAKESRHFWLAEIHLRLAGMIIRTRNNR